MGRLGGRGRSALVGVFLLDSFLGVAVLLRPRLRSLLSLGVVLLGLLGVGQNRGLLENVVAESSG